MWLPWGRKERVGSRMIPRLRTWVEGVTMEPSMLREKVWAERVRERDLKKSRECLGIIQSPHRHMRLLS